MEPSGMSPQYNACSDDNGDQIATICDLENETPSTYWLREANSVLLNNSTCESDLLFDSDLSDVDPDYVPNSADSDSEGEQCQLPWKSLSPHNNNKSLQTAPHDENEGEILEIPQTVPFYENKSQEIPQTAPYENTGHTLEIGQTASQGNNKGQIKGFVVSRAEAKTKRKKHYCLICGQPQSKLKRHLTTQHKEEKDIIQLLNATNETERKIFTKLQSAGDHMQNIRAMQEGKGEMVVKRRKTSTADVETYVPCNKCRGWYAKKDLWRHKCTAKIEDEHAPKKHLVKQGMLLLPQPSENVNFNEIIASLRNDHVSIIARNDAAIRLLGLREAIKNGHDKDRHGHIRNRLRELARLLVELRKFPNSESLGLADFIRPERFHEVILAIRQVAKYDNEHNTYDTPSLALKLGHSLLQCCILLKAKAIETNDTVLLDRTEKYERLHSIKWEQEISANATRTLYTQKMNTTKRLPLTEDVKKLSDYLSAQTDSLIKALEDEKSQAKGTWERLAEVTLARIILFNRRRQGEASKMKLCDVKQGLQTDTHNEDVLKHLSSFERALCKYLHRIEIIGKRGRIVPVLLSGSMKEALECLISKRSTAGVSPENTFVFARTNSNSLDHIRGCDCIRKLAGEAELKCPEKINSTGLRKHIATMTQLVNLKENELDVVAQYLGHDIRTHREYYRLPTSTTQVAKVAKLLVAMEGSASVPADLQPDENEDEFPNDETETDGDIEEVESTNTPTSLKDNCSFKRCSPEKVFADETNTKRDMSRRRPWSEDEKQACKHVFNRWLMSATLPGKKEIEDIQSKTPRLQDRSWVQIKNCITNLIKKNE